MTVPLQLIDANGNFLLQSNDLNELLNYSFDSLKFNVIAILGCQSSGKSTLLNSMFRTSFVELDCLQGVRQTTEGIWISRDAASETIIIDVEGTDSKERGEDRLSFEYRASLFSLAVADTVIINMWYHDIGRYTASNYGLLKTVMRVNLELFGNIEVKYKIKLIFIIRDWSSKVTPLHLLKNMIKKDLDNIWFDMKKPENFQDSSVNELFYFEIYSLPNKLEYPEAFDQEIVTLKNSISSLHKNDSYSRQIPSDGLILYFRNIWETIKKSDELNIPSQREMVASYKCDEFKTLAFEELSINLIQLMKSTNDVWPKLDFKRLVVECVSKFYNSVNFYEETISKLKLKQLLSAIINFSQTEYSKFLNLNEEKLFTKLGVNLENLNKVYDVDNNLSSPVDFWKNLDKILNDWKQKKFSEITDFVESANFTIDLDIFENLEINNEFRFDCLDHLNNVEKKLNMIINKKLVDEQKKFENYLFDKLSDVDSKFFSLQQNESCETYKQASKNLFTDWINSNYKIYIDVLKSLYGINSELSDKFNYLCIRHLFNQHLSKTKWIIDILFKRFTNFFNNDERGVPLQWSSIERKVIEDAFIRAKSNVEQFLPLLLEFNLNVDDFITNQTKEVVDLKADIKKATCGDAQLEKYKSEMKERITEALRQALYVQGKAYGVKSIPNYIWLLLLVLGWNEFVYILKSPMFAVFLISLILIVIPILTSNKKNVLSKLIQFLLSNYTNLSLNQPEIVN